MITINKETLTEKLINEGYIPEYGLSNTVENLLNLQLLENQAPYEMLVEWMNTGRLTKFEPIEGIDIAYLRDTLKMKKPAIILAYGMLVYDPKPNAIFLKKLENRQNAFVFQSK